jgi:hypothetical protein
MKAIFKDGSEQLLSPNDARRALYALTSLAMTPIGPHLNLQRIEDDAGIELWPCLSTYARVC